MALDPLSIAGFGLGAVGSIAQGILGAGQTKKAQKEIDRLKKQRRAYQTPAEIYQMLEANRSRVSTGFDPATMQYLTGQTDNAFGAALGSAELLGADPNSLSTMFNAKVDAMMKIGAEDHERRLANWNRFSTSLETLAANKAAEQKSRQDMIKDDLQAASLEKAAGVQNVGNAINSMIGLGASAATAGLYGAKDGVSSATGAITIPKVTNVTPITTTPTTPSTVTPSPRTLSILELVKNIRV